MLEEEKNSRFLGITTGEERRQQSSRDTESPKAYLSPSSRSSGKPRQLSNVYSGKSTSGKFAQGNNSSKSAYVHRGIFGDVLKEFEVEEIDTKKPSERYSLCASLHEENQGSKPDFHRTIYNHEFAYNIDELPIINNLGIPVTCDALSSMQHLIDGSHSHIFKAKLRQQQKVIVKVIQDQVKSAEIAQGEFQLEHEILARIDHPNIVGYFGCGYSNSSDGDLRQFLVLEYLSGGMLLSMLKHQWKPFPYRRALEIGKSLASALCYLHEGFHPAVTLIHRDLKPDNIGFTSTGTLKLMDFGLCAVVKRRTSTNETYEMSGKSGSLRYMSPEVYKCQPYTEMVDIYTFAIVLWEVATGISPFSGMSQSQWADKVVNRGVRPQLDFSRDDEHPKAHIPLSLARLLTACWHVDWTNRHSARQVVNILTEMLEALPPAPPDSACCIVT